MSAGPAAAQDEPESESQLPEIAPREFEIRGQRQIDFPSLQRQPLRGFATPVAVPTLPPNRIPYVPTYRQERAELPQSLPEPTLVSSELTSSPPPARGLLEARGGRYFTRHLGARLQAPLSDTETVTISADYDGTEGFQPFAGSTVDTPYDDGQARVAFETRQSSVTFQAGVFGALDSYTLYGARPLPGSPALQAPNRSSASGGGDLRLQVDGPVEFDSEVSYQRSRHDTQFVPDSIGPTPRLIQRRVAASAGLSFEAGRTVHLTVDAASAGFGSRSAFEGDVASVDAAGSLVMASSSTLRARVGARLMAFDAAADPERPEAGGAASATFISPTGSVEWSPTRTVTVYAQNEPGLSRRSATDLYDENPFVGHAPSVRPTLETTRFRTGVELTLGPVRIDARGGYRYAPTFLYYVPSESPGFTAAPAGPSGVFSAAYGSAEIFSAGARAAYQGSDRFQASLSLRLRDGTLTGPGTSIPNFAPITSRAAFSYSFADGDGFLRLSGTLESPRFVDRTETRKVGTFFATDLEGSYGLTDLIDLTAAVTNIGSGSLERWDRYPRPPTAFTAGLRIHW